MDDSLELLSKSNFNSITSKKKKILIKNDPTAFNEGIFAGKSIFDTEKKSKAFSLNGSESEQQSKISLLKIDEKDR
jgi:hypothetical protein